MTLSFQPVSLLHQPIYQAYLSKCPEVSSDYGFINLFSWASVYGLEIAWTDSLAWIRQTLPEPVLWAPVGDWHNEDWSDCQNAHPELFKNVIRVPETLSGIWKRVFGDRMVSSEDRNMWDYIYDARELKDLKGNRFHKKKNLVNQFKKNNAYTYVEIDNDVADHAMALQDDWCTWRVCESSEQLAAENQAIMNTLINWENLDGVFGGVIFVDDLIVAYTIGEMLAPDTLAIHFEKGCPDYKGSYQAINQLFLQHQSQVQAVKWVNREPDIGDDGLRKAKLSYHPVSFLKKYRIRFQGSR